MSLFNSLRGWIIPKFIVALIAAFFIFDYTRAKTSTDELKATVKRLTEQNIALQAYQKRLTEQHKATVASLGRNAVEVERINRSSRIISQNIMEKANEEDRPLSPALSQYLDSLRGGSE